MTAAPPDALSATVARFNGFARTGRDQDFHGTKGGLRTNERARVLRADGTPISGLYAAGNASASVMGHSYAGAGATIGPAITFGYLAALDLADAR